MIATAPRVKLRGAPLKLLNDLRGYTGEPRVLEHLVWGPAGTGKSRGIAHVLYWLGFAYPGIRILVVRKTRASLTESFCKTWEEDVVPPQHRMLRGARREQRHAYRFGNGTTLVLGGLDVDTRLFSTDYDVVYEQEVIEISRDEHEKFYRALRNWKGGIPFQWLIADTNPGVPTHWARKRYRDGLSIALKSRHEHNPKWYDFDKKDWTPKGRAYLEGLARLTGVRRRRLYLGQWCAAEGAVWENFDEDIHCIYDRDVPKKDIRWHFAAIDWGHASPGSMLVFGVDGEKRLYMLAELYHTNKGLPWWAERAVEMHKEFNLRAIVADPARDDAISLFNDCLGSHETDEMARICRKANNQRASTGSGDMAGLDLVRHGFGRGEDGKPRLYLVRGALRHTPDPELVEQSQPTCLEDEIPGYVYARREFTQKSSQPEARTVDYTDPSVPDHGCDALRYACAFAWMRDMADPPAAPKFAPWSFGDVLGHKVIA